MLFATARNHFEDEERKRLTLCPGTLVLRTNLEQEYRGTSPIKKRPPPYDPFMTLGMGLQLGPRGERFLTSEVPLYISFKRRVGSYVLP